MAYRNNILSALVLLCALTVTAKKEAKSTTLYRVPTPSNWEATFKRSNILSPREICYDDSSCAECFGSSYVDCPASSYYDCYDPSSQSVSSACELGSDPSGGSPTSVYSSALPQITTVDPCSQVGATCVSCFGPGYQDCGDGLHCYDPSDSQSICPGGSNGGGGGSGGGSGNLGSSVLFSTQVSVSTSSALFPPPESSALFSGLPSAESSAGGSMPTGSSGGESSGGASGASSGDSSGDSAGGTSDATSVFGSLGYGSVMLLAAGGVALAIL